MATFKYKALDNNGEEYEGQVEAEERFAVYSHVREEGGTIVSIEKQNRYFSMERLNLALGRVKTNDLILFARNLAAMLGAGLALSRSLDVLKRQSSNVKFKHVLQGLQNDIASGNNMHTSMKKYSDVFSPLMVAMVRAGEESGKLGEAFSAISEQLQRAYELKKKIRGALIYPAIVVTALVIVGVIMMVFIVPTLSQTFEELGAELPISTQIIIGISDFLVEHTLLAILLFVASVVGFIAALRTQRGVRVFEWTLLHTPLIKGIVKQANSARTARTLASLLSSGVKVVDALVITGEVVQNSYYRAVIELAQEHIQLGKPVAEVFNKHEELYPPLVGELIAVGEETGQLPDMLLEIASFFEKEVHQKTENMSTIVEPFLMLVVGVVVGFFAISMITPIYSITTSI